MGPPDDAGGADEPAGLAATKAMAYMDPVWQAVKDNLGNSSSHAPVGLPQRQIRGIVFPAIPASTPTEMISIAFPMTSTPAPPSIAKEQLVVIFVFSVAAFIWVLPWLCADTRLCCKCWTRCMSKRLGCYFCLGLLANLILVSCVIAVLPDVSANMVFFALVHLIETVCDKLEATLVQCGMVFAAFLAYTFRQKAVTLLGFDNQLVKADLRDCLTCFSMQRLSTIEVSILKATDLPSGFSTRSLFLRVVLGCNEPLHSRPRDGCTTSMHIRERMQLNYDPEDDTQKLSISIKQQEVVGQAVAQLAPAAGAFFGAAGGLMAPFGPQGGAALGAVAGISTANSLGPEIARIEMGAAAINRLRAGAGRQETGRPNPVMSTAPLVPWTEDHFEEVHLVPQGSIWLRIHDLSGP